MSLLRGILFLLFTPILEFLILILALLSVLIIAPVIVLCMMLAEKLSKMVLRPWMTLWILFGIMNICCRTIEIQPASETINASIKLAETIEDPVKKEVISSSLKDMKATIKTQSEIIEQYQKDLEDARLKAEEAQKAKGLVDGIVTIFWSIIALGGIYFLIKIIKRMGFV